MTRKKFVKTLMAAGVKRNYAVALARAYNRKGVSYDVAIAHFSKSLIKAIEAAANRVADIMIYGVECLGKALDEKGLFNGKR